MTRSGESTLSVVISLWTRPERVQLSSKEEIDPRQQDRRHGRERTTREGGKQGLC
jgi:hypothetical protein